MNAGLSNYSTLLPDTGARTVPSPFVMTAVNQTVDKSALLARAPERPPVPNPPGGHLLTHCSIFVTDPRVALDSLEELSKSQGVDCARLSDYRLALVHYTGCDQMHVTISGYRVPNTVEGSEGGCALEYSHEAVDTSAYPAVFGAHKRHLAGSGSGSSSSSGGSLFDSLPPLAAFPADSFDWSVLGADDKAEILGQTDTAQAALKGDMTSTAAMVQTQACPKVRAQGIRSIHEMAALPAGRQAELDSGAYKVILDCINQSAQALSGSRDAIDLYFGPAAPERDMCHNAIANVADMCKADRAAREQAWGARTPAFLSYIAATLSLPLYTHHLELLRSTMRAMLASFEGVSQDNVLLGLGASGSANLTTVIRNLRGRPNAGPAIGELVERLAKFEKPAPSSTSTSTSTVRRA